MKRVELHTHTKYTMKSGISSHEELIEAAQIKGLAGIAFTDSGTLSGLYDKLNRYMEDTDNLQRIYGVETYLLDDSNDIGENLDKVVFLIKTEEGMKNLRYILSDNTFVTKEGEVCVRKSEVALHREGLFVGSSSDNGEVLNCVLQGKETEELKQMMDFYDYIEVCPAFRLSCLLGNKWNYEINEMKDIEALTKKIIAEADKTNIPVVAVSDAYYAYAADEEAHQILARNFGKKCRKDAYLYTTEQLLDEFAYLGEDKAYEIVVANTVKIAEQITEDYLLPDEGGHWIHRYESDKEIRECCEKKAHELYGEKLPVEVENRLREEIYFLCEKGGWEANYLTVADIIHNAELKPYAMLLRGDLGSSFLAYLLGITGEVNPLNPHYRCKNSHYSDFSVTTVRMGCELPDKACPVCGEPLIKDGFRLDWRFFMGYNGERSPYFGFFVAHEKRKAMLEACYKVKGVSDAVWCVPEREEEPSYILLIPDYIERVEDYIPTRQDNKERVLAVDYHSVTHMFESLEILEAPMVNQLAKAAEFTGVYPSSISLDDAGVIESFHIIRSFTDLTRIIALKQSSGTWYGNGENLVSEKIANIEDLICSKEDIFDKLLECGMKSETAFRYAERIRKGKGLEREHEEEFRKYGLPEWYIKSCNKIQYLPPRSHCISYAMIVWYLAYYKLYYPEQFYRAYCDRADAILNSE